MAFAIRVYRHVGNVGMVTSLTNIEQVQKFMKQGRIHGYHSRVREGRSSAGEGYWGIWAGAVS